MLPNLIAFRSNVCSGKHCLPASLSVAARYTERSVFDQIPSSSRRCLSEAVGLHRLCDRRRPDASSPQIPRFSVLLLLGLLLLGCSRHSSDTQPSSDKQTATDSLETTQPQSELPATSAKETSAKELEAKLAPIRAEASSELRLEKRAPDDLAAYLAKLDGKLFDLLLDGGIDESALEQLKNLPSLFHLRVRLSELGDRALDSIVKNHRELQILNVPQAEFTQAGIQQLNKLTKLKQIRLGGSWIDDTIIAEIAKLPKLQHLHLIQPKLTAASLESLADSPKLTSLYIDDCELPDSAWKKLFDAKPKLHVHIDQHHHDRDPGADVH
ncbi:MAG: hypothetical protein VXZ82_18335 [Planctomycetota bacterium]|nr:hypothetical protein [Planctomycetota bacterium]